MKKYKIYFSDYAKNQLKQFEIRKKNHYYLRDSWIFDEELLTGMYLKDVDGLIDEFFNKIYDLLEYWMWGLVIKKHKNYIEYRQISFIRSYIIMIYYEQWNTKNTILIQDIAITT
jgi:hypothetical protein